VRAAPSVFTKRRNRGRRGRSVHVQLARAYTGLAQPDKAAPLLARSEALQRAADERRASAGRRTIAPPQ
jgi:hypothetical protein